MHFFSLFLVILFYIFLFFRSRLHILNGHDTGNCRLDAVVSKCTSGIFFSFYYVCFCHYYVFFSFPSRLCLLQFFVFHLFCLSVVFFFLIFLANPLFISSVFFLSVFLVFFFFFYITYFLFLVFLSILLFCLLFCGITPLVSQGNSTNDSQMVLQKNSNKKD